eukprot:189122-Amphidinium_carterae.1
MGEMTILLLSGRFLLTPPFLLTARMRACEAFATSPSGKSFQWAPARQCIEGVGFSQEGHGHPSAPCN